AMGAWGGGGAVFASRGSPCRGDFSGAAFASAARAGIFGSRGAGAAAGVAAEAAVGAAAVGAAAPWPVWPAWGSVCANEGPARMITNAAAIAETRIGTLLIARLLLRGQHGRRNHFPLSDPRQV